MMTAIDLLIVAIVGISTIIGAFRGVFKEAFSLASWVIGLWLAFNHYEEAGHYIASFGFDDKLSNELVRDITGFFVILAAVFLVLSTAYWIIKNVLSMTGLTPIDRILGVVFGFVRGALIVIMLVYIVGKTHFSHMESWRNAQLIQPFELAGLALSTYIPDVTH